MSGLSGASPASALSRAEAWAGYAACALAVVLMALRAGSAISFAEPLQLATSGYEQESLLAVWERLHGHAVYVSRWDEPFRWAIYNWLYYETYAVVAGGLIATARVVGRMATDRDAAVHHRRHGRRHRRRPCGVPRGARRRRTKRAPGA